MTIEDLNKPNPYINKPLLEGLSFTANDFALLSGILHNAYIDFIEGDSYIDENSGKRLGEMMDEIDKVVSNSEYAQENIRRREFRKQLRNQNV